jgi:hypothetical protein
MKWSTFYKQYLIDKIGEEEIFKRYLERDPRARRNCTNPLRNDKHPGCNFTRSEKTGRIYFNDYAMEKSYDCFAVVMEKYGLTFWQAIRLIEKDFKVTLFSPTIKKEESKNKVDKIPTKKSSIGFEIQDYTQADLDYWAKYCVTQEDLIKYEIFSAKKVYINGTLRWEYSTDNPIYCVEFGYGAIKCYRPLEKSRTNRWLSSTKKEDTAFYYGLPFVGDEVIITKSFKDALVLNVLGYPAVAPSSETISIDTPKFRALKMTYDHVVLLYDNDEVGIRSADKRSKELDIPYVYIPLEYGVKDISDFIEKYGKEETIKLLNNLLNEQNNNINERIQD